MGSSARWPRDSADPLSVPVIESQQSRKYCADRRLGQCKSGTDDSSVNFGTLQTAVRLGHTWQTKLLVFRLEDSQRERDKLEIGLHEAQAANEELLARLKSCQEARAESSERLDESHSARSQLVQRWGFAGG